MRTHGDWRRAVDKTMGRETKAPVQIKTDSSEVTKLKRALRREKAKVRRLSADETSSKPKDREA